MKKVLLVVVLLSFIQQMNMFAQASPWQWAKQMTRDGNY